MGMELEVPIEHAICFPLLIDSPSEPVQTMIDHQGGAADHQGTTADH
jgi:hypothetical protein